MEQPLDIDEKEHAVRFLRSFDSMRKAKKDCDLVIKVGKKELLVHRNVMRAQSDYFDAMFTHDTLEKQSGVVEMKEMKFEPVKKCVDFFYTGKISTSEEGCEDLLFTASMMQVKPICDKIAPFLQCCLSPKSFFNIKKIATKFDIEDLNKICDDFAVEKLDVIAKEKEFEELEMGYVSFLLTSQKTKLSDEDFKMQITLQWIKADIENCRSHLAAMMKNLDLEKISAEYGMSLVQNEKLCGESAECMKMLYVAGMKKHEVDLGPKPNAIVVFDLSSKCLQVNKPALKTWSQMHPLHRDFLGGRYTAVLLQKKLYVLMPNKKVYRLCIIQKDSQWETAKCMLYAHGDWIRATTQDDCIYVTGGSSLERYCLKKDAWESINCGQCPCTENELVEYAGSVYSIGGVGTCAKSIFKYDPVSVSWSKLKSMNVSRATSASTVYRGKLFVAGGICERPCNDVEVYDAGSDTWSLVASMTKPHNLFSLCVIGDRLYAFGNELAPLSIEVYDQDFDDWRIILKNPTMKVMAQATVSASLPE